MPETTPPQAELIPLRTGIALRCPRCGKGRIYDGLLKLQEKCPSCQLDFAAFDTGDGPAFLVVSSLGVVVTLLAVWLDAAFSPPFWLQGLIWVPFVMLSSIGLLRLLKSLLVSFQYFHRIGFDHEPS